MEALQWANDILKTRPDHGQSNLDSPMLDVEVLLAAVLDVGKPWLFTHLDCPLTPKQEERFHTFIRRRAAFEPVAYIVGSKEFYKRRFQVNRFVLIPRPATESLVEHALSAASGPERDQTVFADIGTGSGAIAVTLAAESRLPVFATDISRQAVAIAKTNATEHRVDDLVDVRQGNLIEPVVRVLTSVSSTHPDAIRRLVLCANLPYLTHFQVETGQREVRDFEPREALVAGQDGLDAYWDLFRQLKKHRQTLPKSLGVLIEIDPSQRQAVTDLICHDFTYAQPTVHKDLDGFDRIVASEL